MIVSLSRFFSSIVIPIAQERETSECKECAEYETSIASYQVSPSWCGGCCCLAILAVSRPWLAHCERRFHLARTRSFTFDSRPATVRCCRNRQASQITIFLLPFVKLFACSHIYPPIFLPSITGSRPSVNPSSPPAVLPFLARARDLANSRTNSNHCHFATNDRGRIRIYNACEWTMIQQIYKHICKTLCTLENLWARPKRPTYYYNRTARASARHCDRRTREKARARALSLSYERMKSQSIAQEELPRESRLLSLFPARSNLIRGPKKQRFTYANARSHELNRNKVTGTLIWLCLLFWRITR